MYINTDDDSSTSDESKQNQIRQSSCAKVIFDDTSYFEVNIIK
jgi:hypothetical protein